MTAIRRAMKVRRGRGEHGVSILLALIFLSLFGLIVGVVLTQIQTGVKTTTVVSDKSAKVFAADGGIDFGIQAVRSSSTSPPICRNSAAGVMDVGDVTVNGRTVHVTCKTLAGDGGATGGIGGGGPFGPSGYTMIATGFGNPAWGTTKASPPCRSIRPDLGYSYRNVAGLTTVKDSTTITGPAGSFLATDVNASLTGIVGQNFIDNNGNSIVSVAPGGASAVMLKKAKNTSPAGGVTAILGTTTALTNIGYKVILCPDADVGQTVIVGGTKSFVAKKVDLPIASNNALFEGALIQNDPYCAADQVTYAGSVTVNGGWTCTGATVPWPQYPDMRVVVPANLAHASTTGVCSTVTVNPKDGKTKTTNVSIRYLYPGKYTAQPPADTYTFMMSGVYYFENTGETVIGGGGDNIWGGEPHPGGDGFLADSRQNPLPAGCESKFTDAAAKTACNCATDPYVGAADPGKGVTLVLGGTTIFDIHADSTELFSRKPGTMDAGATQRTTIFAWPPSPVAPAGMISGGAYIPHDPGLTSDRCNCSFVTDKSGEQITFHGMTYSPFAPVDVFNNATLPVFKGGVVANEIVARVESGAASGQFAGQIGASGQQPTQRTVLITATADPGGNPVVSSAIITIEADTNRTTVIKSWRNQGAAVP